MLLEKKGSRRIIEITTDVNDDWFLHVNWIEKKSNIVSDTSMIIRKDLEGWVRYLKTMGWLPKEEQDFDSHEYIEKIKR